MCLFVLCPFYSTVLHPTPTDISSYAPLHSAFHLQVSNGYFVPRPSSLLQLILSFPFHA